MSATILPATSWRKTVKLTLDSAGTKTRVKMVGDLLEQSSRNQITLLIDGINLNRPLSLREALDLRGLVAVIQPVRQLVLQFSRMYVVVRSEGKRPRCAPCRSPVGRISLKECEVGGTGVYSFRGREGGG